MTQISRNSVNQNSSQRAQSLPTQNGDHNAVLIKCNKEKRAVIRAPFKQWVKMIHSVNACALSNMAPPGDSDSWQGNRSEQNRFRVWLPRRFLDKYSSALDRLHRSQRLWDFCELHSLYKNANVILGAARAIKYIARRIRNA
ncbi:unnamed protein product [Colias eurytheme]|nr:unnamed protein product [Colias eurytheme]